MIFVARLPVSWLENESGQEGNQKTKGQREPTLLAGTLAWPAGTSPQGAVPFSRRPPGRGRGQICFHFEKPGAGSGVELPRRGEVRRVRLAERPLPGSEVAVTLLCVGVAVSTLAGLLFGLQRHVGWGEGEYWGEIFCVGIF